MQLEQDCPLQFSQILTKNKLFRQARTLLGEKPKDLCERMLKITSACLLVCAGLPLWAEGGAAAGAKGAKSAPSVKLPGPAFVALETITPEHIRWHVRYLSHDLLEGRGTGQRGGDIAAEYIATQFAEYGLKPAGDHGTYMQKVPLVGITTLPETTFSWCQSKARRCI
jgi:hypothetical protein